MVKSPRRNAPKKGRKKKPSYQLPVRVRWWRKGDVFTVDYIECAVSVPSGDKRSWMYCTKWYLYSRTENTWETASTFTECEHPILQRFWKSAGITDLNELNEPEPTEPTEGSYEVYESRQKYRKAEAAETLRFSREDDEEEEEEEEENIAPEQSGPIGCSFEENATFETYADFDNNNEVEGDSDTEIERLLLTDAFANFAIEEIAPDSPLFFEEERSSCEAPTPPPAAILASRQPLLYGTWEAVFNPDGNTIVPPISNTVVPADTMKRFLNPARPRPAPKSKSLSTKHSALRPGNTVSPSNFTGKAFHSTPDVSMRDKSIRRYQWNSGTPKERSEKRIKYFTEEYTKQVDKNRLAQLKQAPPFMERAAWSQSMDVDTPPSREQLASDVNPNLPVAPGALVVDAISDSALYDEYIQEPEAAMLTLNNLPAQQDDLPMKF